ncbi:hypothetical protein QMM87_15070 [Leptospira santarosai]|uniref:hypothetical protein n=1 Tax=Leptospira santarosai TaxID=28183 RepID=UPI0024AEDEB6|nr:hypothetical protein [Leptospira santarosai]MDI7229973.1 hypothetical protein [Leptospira santarosai]
MKPSNKNAGLESLEKLASSDNIVKGLAKHFSYLADSPGFELVLEQIMREAKSVEISKQNGNLIVKFDEDILTASPPLDKKKLGKWPKSFQNLMTVHGSLSLEKAQLYLGPNGAFESEDLFEYLDDLEDKQDILGEINADEILSPITDYSDWWLYHPTKKNKEGQPLLFFYSHEGYILEKRGCNVGSLFLELLAEKLKIPINIPAEETSEVVSWWQTRPGESNILSFWHSSGDDFPEEFDQEPEGDFLKGVRGLFLSRGVRSLSELPLSHFKNLKKLVVCPHKDQIKFPCESLAGIEQLESLEHFEIYHSKIDDLSPLKELKNLRQLDIGSQHLIDLRPLCELTTLSVLGIASLALKDVSPLVALKGLTHLRLSGCKNLKDVDVLLDLGDLKVCKLPNGSKEFASKYLKKWKRKIEI